MKSKSSLLIFLFLFLSQISYGIDTLKLSNSMSYADLKLYSQIFSNDSLNFSNANIQNTDSQFKSYHDSLTSINTISYWFKIIIQNKDTTPSSWIIGYGNSNEEILLYEKNGGSLFLKHKTGTLISAIYKDLFTGKDDLTEVKLKPGEIKCVYIKVTNKSDFAKNLFAHNLSNFKIYSNKYYTKSDYLGRIFNAIFYGAASIMFLYNLIIAISLKSKDYALYVIFSFLIIWFNIFSDGYAYESFLSNFPNNDRLIRIIILPILLSSYLLFTKVYLKSNKFTPLLNKIFPVFWVLLALTYAPGIFGYWSVSRTSMIIVTLCAMVFVFIASVSSYKQGFKPALYFILANTLLIISSILFTLNLTQIFTSDFLVRLIEYQFQFSTIIEIGIFSLGLANRIKVAEKENAIANQRAISALVDNEKLIREQNIMLEEKVKERTEKLLKSLKEVEVEKIKSEKLLLNILPAVVADELKEFGFATPQYFDQVTILFADFVNFSTYAANETPQILISKLNQMFHLFDEICERNGLEKIKTIGDCYMAVGGIPIENRSNAKDSIQAGLEMLDCLKSSGWDLRVGIHTGPVISGVIGKHKFAYDIWGDAVNIASRLQSASEPNRVNISQITYDLVKNQFKCTHRGKITSKNKVELEMYFVDSKE